MNNTETVRICLTSIPRISDVIHFVWIRREFSSSVRKPEMQETRKFKQTICVYYVSIAMDLIMVVIKSRCLCNNVCCIRTRDYFFYAQPAQQHHSFFVLSEFAISVDFRRAIFSTTCILCKWNAIKCTCTLIRWSLRESSLQIIEDEWSNRMSMIAYLELMNMVFPSIHLFYCNFKTWARTQHMYIHPFVSESLL